MITMRNTYILLYIIYVYRRVTSYQESVIAGPPFHDLHIKIRNKQPQRGRITEF